MQITFKSLHESHFPLLLKWLMAPHVKEYWDQDVNWTLALIEEKYSSYARGYKIVDGIEKPIKAYIIEVDSKPIGYIQLYNAHDFGHSKKHEDLPEKLGSFDIFIGEKEYLGQDIGSATITKFVQIHADNYTHIFVAPDLDNITATKAYEKAGFQKMLEQKDNDKMWMIWERPMSQILEELKMREPIFHHPDKFGKSKQDIEAQMCDEFFEVGASGNVYTRKIVIETLLERYNDPDYQDLWETKDFKLLEIAPDNYLLTYTLIQNNTRMTKRSTIWRRVKGIWKIIYHQGTVV